MSIFTNLSKHYKKKFPGCQVQLSEQSLEVYKDGEHLISLAKNGCGGVVDLHEDAETKYAHDLSNVFPHPDYQVK